MRQTANAALVLLLAADWAQAAEGGAPRLFLDAHALGTQEAVLEYCAANDPEGAARIRSGWKRLVQGASKEALADVRASAEYRGAHDAEADFIGKSDPHNAHRLCRVAAARRQ